MKIMKRLPFPTEILDIPQVTRLNTSAYGIFVRLIMNYWNTGLPLPESDYAIVRLSNSDYGAWNRHKEVLLEVLRVIMPKLQVKYEKALKRSLGRSYIAKLGGAANAMRIKLMANQAVQEVMQLADESNFEHAVVTPIHSPKSFNPGQTDHVARKKAIKSNKTSPITLLTDE